MPAHPGVAASLPPIQSLDRVPQAAWDRLAQRRVYFGHQSVGYNVLAGAAELMKERPAIRMRVVESADPRALEQPALVHSKNGSNADAASKMQAFANLMNAGAGERAEVAFFKLCYVDIGDRTDPAAEFARYRDAMDDLAGRYPRVRFLHVTAPLTALPTGPKQTFKRALGRPLWGYEHNARRGEYNQRLLEHFGRPAVFDLAAIEAAGPGGARATYRHAGREHTALHPANTDDGGHLGTAGRSAAGAAFLAWLAEAAA